MCVCVSHSHGSAINRVVLYEDPSRMPVFVLHQVEQRVAHLLVVDAGDGVSHGEHFDYVRSDPDNQVDCH